LRVVLRVTIQYPSGVLDVVDVVTYAAGRRALLVLQRQLPIKNDI
jgi:hypothetical protein